MSAIENSLALTALVAVLGGLWFVVGLVFLIRARRALDDAHRTQVRAIGWIRCWARAADQLEKDRLAIKVDRALHGLPE